METGCLMLCRVRSHFLNLRDLLSENMSGALSPPLSIEHFRVDRLILSFGRVDLADQMKYLMHRVSC